MNEGVKGGQGRHDDGAELECDNSERRDRLSGGDTGLNTILNGGIPRDSLYIVTGPPGAGKTVFAQQMSFAAAAVGLRVIYFTNVSEPHAKLVQHMRGFAFYEPDVVGERIRIYNITAQIRDKGFKETCNFIVETVRGERANLVIIDSFRGLKHVLDVHPRDRGAIFDLAAQSQSWAAPACWWANIPRTRS
jgi:circadian clock protein KaiC